jgi:hypothetical protein
MIRVKTDGVEMEVDEVSEAIELVKGFSSKEKVEVLLESKPQNLKK